MGGKTRVLSPDRSRDSGSQCPRVVWGQAATACPFKHLGDLAGGIAIVTRMQAASVIVNFRSWTLLIGTYILLADLFLELPRDWAKQSLYQSYLPGTG